MNALKKSPRTPRVGFLATAYASEAQAAQSDTLKVAPSNPCLSCHAPDSTHSRYSADSQITIGPNIGFGANGGMSLTDSSKVSFSANASFIVGVSGSVTENSKAGTPAMPVITVDTTSTQVDTSN